MASQVDKVDNTMKQSLINESNKIKSIIQSNRDLRTENKVYTGLLVTCIILLLFYSFMYYILYYRLFYKIIDKDGSKYNTEKLGEKSIIESIKIPYNFGIFMLFIIFSLVIFSTCVVFNNLVFPNIKTDLNNTATITFVSYIFIVGFTLVTIHFVAPGLITIFENTIGYGFLNAFFPKSLNIAMNGNENAINDYKNEIKNKALFLDGAVNNGDDFKLPNSVITNSLFGMNYVCGGATALTTIELTPNESKPPASPTKTSLNDLLNLIQNTSQTPSTSSNQTQPITSNADTSALLSLLSIDETKKKKILELLNSEDKTSKKDLLSTLSNNNLLPLIDETKKSELLGLLKESKMSKMDNDILSLLTNNNLLSTLKKGDNENVGGGNNNISGGAGEGDSNGKSNTFLLGDFILRKHLIGHMCWMYLSSVTALLTSISAYGVYALNGTNG